MKKPAKPKPRPRRRGQNTTALRSAASLPAAHETSKRHGRDAARTARSVATHYSPDDCAALALLLAPFLILSAMLASSHAWRQTRMLAPDMLARHAPAVPRPATPAPAPLIVPPGASPVYPPAPPAISVASLEARPLRPAIVLPGVTPSYRPAMPWLPPAGREIDIATWSAPVNAWESRLRQPPAVDPPQAMTWTSGGTMCLPSEAKLASFSVVGPRTAQPQRQRVSYADPSTFGLALAGAALAQTGELVFYTARYRRIAYPMGDIASLHGTCTDVIIRAYRSLGIDLQQLVHEFRSGGGDPNIDHRRTEMLRRFFTTQGASLPITSFPEDYKPGDIVTYHRPFGRISNAHIAIVSDRLSAVGRPMVIHNRGFGPQLEDALFADRITGHFRFAGPPPATLAATGSLSRGVGERRAGFSTMSFSTVGIPHRRRHSTASD